MHILQISHACLVQKRPNPTIMCTKKKKKNDNTTTQCIQTYKLGIFYKNKNSEPSW